jgi:DNA-binding response OmpR family regulator
MVEPLKTVAIADDEPGLRDVLKIALSDLGYQVVGVWQQNAQQWIN